MEPAERVAHSDRSPEVRPATLSVQAFGVVGMVELTRWRARNKEAKTKLQGAFQLIPDRASYIVGNVEDAVDSGAAGDLVGDKDVYYTLVSSLGNSDQFLKPLPKLG